MLSVNQRSRLQNLLNDNILHEVLDEVKQALGSELLSTAQHERNKREDLYNLYGLVDKLEAVFINIQNENEDIYPDGRD